MLIMSLVFIRLLFIVDDIVDKRETVFIFNYGSVYQKLQ